MQARGLLNHRLKYCWRKVIYCICQPNELEREITKKLGGQAGGPSKNLGPKAHPGPPLESPLVGWISGKIVSVQSDTDIQKPFKPERDRPTGNGRLYDLKRFTQYFKDLGRKNKFWSLVTSWRKLHTII